MMVGETGFVRHGPFATGSSQRRSSRGTGLRRLRCARHAIHRFCSGLPAHRDWAHPFAVGSKSRETIYGASVGAAAERAAEARKQADRLAVEAWNKRML